MANTAIFSFRTNKKTKGKVPNAGNLAHNMGLNSASYWLDQHPDLMQSWKIDLSKDNQDYVDQKKEFITKFRKTAFWIKAPSEQKKIIYEFQVEKFDRSYSLKKINEKWNKKINEIEKRYSANHRSKNNKPMKMRTNAVRIEEALIGIGIDVDELSKEQIKKAVELTLKTFEEKYGGKVFHWSFHDHEGHTDYYDGKTRINRHIHVLFENVDDNGLMVKSLIPRDDFSHIHKMTVNAFNQAIPELTNKLICPKTKYEKLQEYFVSKGMPADENYKERYNKLPKNKKAAILRKIKTSKHIPMDKFREQAYQADLIKRSEISINSLNDEKEELERLNNQLETSNFKASKDFKEFQLNLEKQINLKNDQLTGLQNKHESLISSLSTVIGDTENNISSDELVKKVSSTKNHNTALIKKLDKTKDLWEDYQRIQAKNNSLEIENRDLKAKLSDLKGLNTDLRQALKDSEIATIADYKELKLQVNQLKENKATIAELSQFKDQWLDHINKSQEVKEESERAKNRGLSLEEIHLNSKKRSKYANVDNDSGTIP